MFRKLLILGFILFAGLAKAQNVPNPPSPFNPPRVSKTTNYSPAAWECGSLFALGGNSYFVITINAATSYTANCSFTFVNEDSGRAKLIYIPTANPTYFYLWPLQSVTVYNENNTWQTQGRSRWRIPALTHFCIDLVSGSASADGLATSGAGCLNSFQNLYNLLAQEIDQNGQNLTIDFVAGQTDNLGTGLFPDFNVYGPLVGNGGWNSGVLTIDGHGTTLSPSGATWCLAVQVATAAVVTQNFTVTGCTYGIAVGAPGIYTFNNMTFGPATGAHILASGSGSIATVLGTTTFLASANAPYHFLATQDGTIDDCSTTVTTSGGGAGSVTFTSGYAGAVNKGLVQAKACNGTATFNGTFVGPRFNADYLSLITGMGSSTYYPGNAGGTATNSSYAN